MPMCAIRYKIEPLCQLPKPRFEAEVPFGDIPCFLVCRQKMASAVPFFRRLNNVTGRINQEMALQP
jgi:hypothetical protein